MALDQEVVHDAQILDDLDGQLAKANLLLRGVCMACSSCFELEPPATHPQLKVYTEFKKNVANEAIVFKKALLPLTLCVLMRISELFQIYFEKTFSVWKKTVPDTQAVAKEHEQLCWCLSEWYKLLLADTAKFEGLAKPVLDLLDLEDRRIKTDEHVLSVKSKICPAGDLFVPLLFVPRFGSVATPYVHGPGSASRMFRPPPVARNLEEEAAASTLTMTKTFVPGIRLFAATMAEISVSLGEVRKILERLYRDAVNADFDEESEIAMQRHFDVVYNRSPAVKIRCSDIHVAESFYQTYTEEVPYDRDKYAPAWMEEAKAPDGEFITDKVYDITKNVEVLGLMDGF